MYNVNYILWISVAIQIIAVILALRLIPISRRALAWIILSIAFAFMATRRTVSLLYLQNILQDKSFSVITAESIALLISILLAIGLFFGFLLNVINL